MGRAAHVSEVEGVGNYRTIVDVTRIVVFVPLKMLFCREKIIQEKVQRWQERVFPLQPRAIFVQIDL